MKSLSNIIPHNACTVGVHSTYIHTEGLTFSCCCVSLLIELSYGYYYTLGVSCSSLTW